jgi:hypothetical protein
MPEKTLKILYTGPQPVVFTAGRMTEPDKAGNVTEKEAGVEIRLLPSASLPPERQHQPVDAVAWAKIKAHKVNGPTVAHMLKIGQIHEFWA